MLRIYLFPVLECTVGSSTIRTDFKVLFAMFVPINDRTWIYIQTQQTLKSTRLHSIVCHQFCVYLTMIQNQLNEGVWLLALSPSCFLYYVHVCGSRETSLFCYNHNCFLIVCFFLSCLSFPVLFLYLSVFPSQFSLLSFAFLSF